MGLWDLVLTQIVFVVGTVWVGTAAKLGDEQLFFWLLAIATFYLPLAAVVIHLNRLMPLEGGLYQWAKLGFNEFVGYMVAWNLWVFAILVMSGIGMLWRRNLSYAFGAELDGARASWFITLFSFALVGGMVSLSTRGLSLGKWVHNAGGVLLLVDVPRAHTPAVRLLWRAARSRNINPFIVRRAGLLALEPGAV